MRSRSIAIALLSVAADAMAADGLPNGFVYLRDVAATVRQDLRYHGTHNFVGRPIAGYLAPECILTAPAAQALARVQAELAASSLSLVVYDCYRPQRAVDDFLAWGSDPSDQRMKAEFYPRVDKADFVKLGYVADKSGHSRGSTVDLAIAPLPLAAPAPYLDSAPKVDCAAPMRWRDGSLDFGTAFDCMDPASHVDATSLPPAVLRNRALLRGVMLKNGFKGYDKEWWHFTLADEPFPQTYFNFAVTAPGR